MNESISRAAGTEHGQEFPPEAMEALIRSLGAHAGQRTTLYGGAMTARAEAEASYDAEELTPVGQTAPRRKAQRSGARPPRIPPPKAEGHWTLE